MRRSSTSQEIPFSSAFSAASRQVVVIALLQMIETSVPSRRTFAFDSGSVYQPSGISSSNFLW